MKLRMRYLRVSPPTRQMLCDQAVGFLADGPFEGSFFRPDSIMNAYIKKIWTLYFVL